MDANRIAMIEGVDYVIGNHDKINFLEYLDNEKPEVPVIVRERISREDFSIGFVGEPNFEQRANLKIQDGCDFMCSFCVIPFSRGRARSRDLEDLVTEVHRMVENGVKEIVLTGVNLGTYFSNGLDFLGLLEKISKVKNLSRIRISSIEPTTIPDEIFQWMADENHPLMPYLHVPLQSGCNVILKRMKRKYDLLEMAEFFDRATSEVPNICLGTDLMVGFPGETKDYFRETCDTFINFPLAYCHVFTFSERKGTPAAKIQEQIPMDERRKRSAHLRRISASKRMDFFKSQEGEVRRVLFENPKDKTLAGYTDNYTKVIIENPDISLANQFVDVRLMQANPEFVLGELV